MKRSNVVRFVAAFLLCAFMIATASFAQEAKKENPYKVKIQTSAYSAMCKNRIETKVADLKGVSEAFLSLETKVLTVKYDKNLVSSDDITKAITKMGYEAEVLTDKAEADESAAAPDRHS